ncbi:MAG TPA: hypothetical protein VKW04_08435 [Planctomycetota bacterium]|nr:hypothetical protein [Planctomycetota bacterium]
MTDKAARRLADAERLRALVEKYRAGEDPDLSEFCRALWEMLYAEIPSLTRTKSKSAQHRILETHLVKIGLPHSPDLQYIAGPVLWFARERQVVPPAQDDEHGTESWHLDLERYEEVGRALDEGRAAFGDWMANTLRELLAEQQ